VRASQRTRLRRAVVELVGERGYRGLTVRAVSRTSGVSTRTFYSHFANTGEAFGSTCEWLIGCAAERAAAQPGSGDPELTLHRGLRRLFDAIAEDPAGARLVLVDSYAEEPARNRVRAAQREFERLLTQVLAPTPGPPISARVVEGMVAGVEFVARSHLLAGHAAELPALADQLAAWILALREVAEVAPAAPARPAPTHNGATRPDALAAALRSAAGDARGRLLVAVTRLAISEGYASLTVTKIRAEAGVSRRGFDAHFAGVEDCFLAAVDALTTVALAEPRRLLTAAGDWEANVERASLALCEKLARNPAASRLVLVEARATGLAGLHHRDRTIHRIASGLRAAAPPDRRAAELTAQASAAAAWQIVEAEVAAGRATALPQLAPTLAQALTHFKYPGVRG
jgi:AcrR family transcriptional regulator